uniref:Uncharacterized protein n=1 Tax=Nothobranchius furzeri TaxID=105023 RepID=A0A8C6PRH6_NOTFU
LMVAVFNLSCLTPNANHSRCTEDFQSLQQNPLAVAQAAVSSLVTNLVRDLQSRSYNNNFSHSLDPRPALSARGFLDLRTCTTCPVSLLSVQTLFNPA